MKETLPKHKSTQKFGNDRSLFLSLCISDGKLRRFPAEIVFDIDAETVDREANLASNHLHNDAMPFQVVETETFWYKWVDRYARTHGDCERIETVFGSSDSVLNVSAKRCPEMLTAVPKG